jgi:hypothetical protein
MFRSAAEPWGAPMSACARSLALALLGIVATFEAPQAQTIAETAVRWGLLGTWRLDCSQPRSRSNPDLMYVVRGGKLYHDREFGDSRDSSAVMSATVKRDKSLEVVVNFVSLKQTRQFSFMKGPDGRIRAVSNRNVDTNDYTVRDGKFTSNGNMTPWQTRCR